MRIAGFFLVLIKKYKTIVFSVVFLFLYSVAITYAVPPATPYNPAETLDPSCIPGSSNCSVQIIPDQTGNAGEFLTTDGTNVSWATAVGSSSLSGLTIATGTNTIDNTNYQQEWQWNTLAGGTGLRLSSTSTDATGNTQKVLEILQSGANATTTQTTYGGYFSNTKTGTLSTNVGIYARASGGATANYAGVFEGDISNLATTNANPVVLGSVSTAGSTPRSVYVSGRYAYVVNSGAGTLKVIDISNPASPSVTGSVSTGSAPFSVYVSGRYAYVVNNISATLQVIDISNPASPSVTGSVSTQPNPRSIYVSGRYAYIGNNSATSFQVIDISNPASPSVTGSVSTGSTPFSVYVSGGYAYVVNNAVSGTMQVIDISNPASPSVTGSVSTGSTPLSVYVSGRYAYVVNSGGNTMQVIDISNPASPSVTGSVSTGSTPFSVYVSGRYAYVVNSGGNTMQVIDISNPASPSVTGSVSTGSAPFSVYVSGRYAYVVNSGAGTLQTIDVHGIEATSAMVHSLETGNLQVRNDILAQGQIQATGGITAGNGGINSSGPISVFSSLTTAGSGLNITTNSITTGTAFIIPHTTSIISSGGSLLRLSSTSADTSTTTGSLLDLSSSAGTSTTLARISASALTTGKLMDLQISGTAAAASQTALNILTTGANSTAGITTYGAQISNTHSTNTSTNVALYLNASGGATANYGLIVNAGDVGIGSTTPTSQLQINGRTLGGSSTTDNWLNITATMPTTMSASTIGSNMQITGAGSSSQNSYAFNVDYLAGYTGSSHTTAGKFINRNAGTNTSGPQNNDFGNIGLTAQAIASTAGHNYALHGYAKSGVLNVGVIGQAQTASNDGMDMGVVGLARNAGSGSASEIAGYFAIMSEATGLPSGISAALIANNGSGTRDIFKAQDNSGDVFNIIDGGNVGIGDPTPSYRLEVLNDTASSYVSSFFNDGNNDNRLGIQIQAGADTPAAGKWIQFNDGDGGDVGSINLIASVLTLTTTSDQRLKENIVDTAIGLQMLKNIKVRDFSFIRDTNHNTVHGFIAQELAEIYPDAVLVPENPDEYWKVSYSQLTPLIIKSIQDIDIKYSSLLDLTSTDNTFRTSLMSWLADASNGLGELFAKKIKTEKVDTKELCIEDLCITRDQLFNLMQSSGTENTTPTEPVVPEEGTDDSDTELIESEDSLDSERPVVEETASEEPTETLSVEEDPNL